LKSPALFKKSLLKYIANNKVDVLFPVSSRALYTVSSSLDIFSQYTSVPIPPYDTVMKAVDKALTVKIAEAIPCPKTYIPKKISEVSALAKKVDYPIVVKPRISSGSRGLKYAANPAELRYHFETTAKKYGSPLVQEYIPGNEIYGVSALLNKNSKPRAVFVHKRIRQFPITGGPSTYRVSVSKPSLTKLGLKLLEEMKWYGVAMVEFKVDIRDDKPKLIEINPRFVGSLNLAIAAGVDFPYLLYKMAVEGDVHPILNYKLGVKARYLLFGDVLHLMASPSRLKLLPEFMTFYERNLSYDILDSDDFLPAVIRLLNGARSMFSHEMWEYAYTRA
jgi:predicted ATP-grasp superfamily ATP-dependent carboligase